MKNKRSLNIIIFGLLSQAITIMLGVLLPKLYISYYGSEINGLLASVNQIFVYIGLFEAGVGTATLVALYGPVAQNRQSKISSILAATNIYYRKTGIYYLIAVLVFAGVYPFILVSGINKITIGCIILISGITGLINFFFQGKFSILLDAEGKSYITTNLILIVNILTSLTKIFLIVKGSDIILVQSVFIIYNVLQIVCIYAYISKKYKWLNLKTEPDFKAISKKNSVLIHQLSALIFSNTDIIILTIFCNLRIVSVYALYGILFGVIGTFLNTLSRGFAFRMGQMYHTDIEKYNELYNIFEFYFILLLFALYAVAFVFILPFLKLYTANFTDINYIDSYLPYLFVTISLLSYSRAAPSMAIMVSEHFKETQWRSITESIINLSLSIVLVITLGIYGVLIATILALLYRTNDMILYVNKRIVPKSARTTYKRIIVNLGLFILIVFLSDLLGIKIESFTEIIAWAALYSVVSIAVFIMTNLLFDKKVFRVTVNYVGPYWHRMLKYLRIKV